MFKTQSSFSEWSEKTSTQVPNIESKVTESAQLRFNNNPVSFTGPTPFLVSFKKPFGFIFFLHVENSKLVL